MGFDYKTDDVLKPCQTKLQVEFKANGKHFRGWYVLDGEKCISITVSKGSKPMGQELFSQMAKEFHLSKQDFARFLDCPLKEDEYVAIQHEIKRTGHYPSKK